MQPSKLSAAPNRTKRKRRFCLMPFFTNRWKTGKRESGFWLGYQWVLFGFLPGFILLDKESIMAKWKALVTLFCRFYAAVCFWTKREGSARKHTDCPILHWWFFASKRRRSEGKVQFCAGLFLFRSKDEPRARAVFLVTGSFRVWKNYSPVLGSVRETRERVRFWSE